ncbi:major capsid protein [Cupriavidus taiwanensis]|uniref:major capsid protein n=1 Tax=Cupriavidus taiwanensis TaxID=164546 RepID=UPI0039C4E1A3
MFKSKKAMLAALAALSVAAGNAVAAVPTEVSTAMTDAKADSATIAGLALAIIIGIAAFKYMRRGV